MKPISPVAHDPETRWGVREVTFAKDQPEYMQLPALKFHDDEGLVVTRWKPSLVERIVLFLGGSLYLGILTFNHPLQPVKLSVSIQDVV